MPTLEFYIFFLAHSLSINFFLPPPAMNNDRSLTAFLSRTDALLLNTIYTQALSQKLQLMMIIHAPVSKYQAVKEMKGELQLMSLRVYYIVFWDLIL